MWWNRNSQATRATTTTAAAAAQPRATFTPVERLEDRRLMSASVAMPTPAISPPAAPAAHAELHASSTKARLNLVGSFPGTLTSEKHSENVTFTIASEGAGGSFTGGVSSPTAFAVPAAITGTIHGNRLAFAGTGGENGTPFSGQAHAGKGGTSLAGFILTTSGGHHFRHTFQLQRFITF